MKKRAISFLALICILSQCLLPASATTINHYTDVSSSAYYYDAVNYLYEHGLMVGGGSNQFVPENSLTRGALVTVLWAMLNKPNPSGTSTVFSDVSSSRYYYKAIAWASSSNVGIVAGYGDGRFGPDDNVTQQDALVFLHTFMVYCGYLNNSTTSRNGYISCFNNSNLVNKNRFSNYAKVAVGWAYSNNFIRDNSLNPTTTNNRALFAYYIYNIYCTYQKKYALAVTCSNNMSYASACGDAMSTLFRHNGAACTTLVDISKSNFSAAMNNRFSAAKKLDICYLFFQAHGNVNGLYVFTGTGTNQILSPDYLRSQVDQYQGMFVIFVSGCNSGTYVENPLQEEAVTDIFDADSFVADLVGEEVFLEESVASAESNLAGDVRIKVICSSEKHESSYTAINFAVKYWCLGGGYNLNQDSFVTKYADADSDNRISLEELYSYSYAKVLEGLANVSNYQQHIVRYPANDHFIILEEDY